MAASQDQPVPGTGGCVGVCVPSVGSSLLLQRGRERNPFPGESSFDVRSGPAGSLGSQCTRRAGKSFAAGDVMGNAENLDRVPGSPWSHLEGWAKGGLLSKVCRLMGRQSTAGELGLVVPVGC